MRADLNASTSMPRVMLHAVYVVIEALVTAVGRNGTLRPTSGSMPCEKRLIASVTRHTFPVRSPLPNRQPSTRSAPSSR